MNAGTQSRDWTRLGKILLVCVGAALLYWSFIRSAQAASVLSEPAAIPGAGPQTSPEMGILPQVTASGLAITKTHTDPFVINTVGFFALQVRNVSTNTISGPITVTDNLPAAFTYVSGAGIGVTCSNVGQLVTCPISNSTGLAPSTSYDINLGVNVLPPPDSAIANTASLTHAGETVSDVDSVNVVGVDLAVTKSASPGTVAVGGTVTYLVGVSNRGTAAATSVVLTDQLDSHLTFSSASATKGSYTQGNGQWGIGDLAINEIVTLTLRATVNANSSGLTITDATNGLSSNPTDYNSANNTASASVQVSSAADLRVTKTDNRTTVAPDLVYTYTITVDNIGTINVPDLVITDTLSPYLTLITDTMGVNRTKSGDLYIWNIPDDLAAGDGVDYFVRVEVDSTLPSATTSVVNRVDVRTSITETLLTNNTATDTDTGSGTRSVSISNSVSPVSVQTGQSTTYTIRVTNNGSGAVTDVVVTDTFSQYVDVSSASTSKGSRTISSRLVTANMGTLNAGQSATLTVVVRVNNVATANTTVSNTASMSYKFGSITYTGSASSSFSLIRGSTLPGTGGIELSPAEKSAIPTGFYIALLSALALAALGLAGLAYGLVARLRQSDWSGWAMRMGLLFIFASFLFGLAAVGIFGIANLEPQPTLVALFKVATREVPTRVAEQDPDWVGLAPTEEPLVLPDFPIPEPTNVPPVDENGNQPDTSPVNRIILPTIGVDTVVKYVPYDGFTWLIAGLQQEIAWMGDTSWPGLGGNTGLAGHVSLRNGRDGPFRYLDSVQPNDQVRLYTEENIYIYSIREKQIVGEADFTVIEPTDDSQLTLITCTNWDTVTSLYRERLIVIADLVGVEPLKKTSQGN